MLHSKDLQQQMRKYCKLDTPLNEEPVTDVQEDAHIPVSSTIRLVRTW